MGPELIGCRLVKRQQDGSLLWGVVVETEVYSQQEPARHGFRSHAKRNATLFCPPGHWHVYLTGGIHHGVKRAVMRKAQSRA